MQQLITMWKTLVYNKYSNNLPQSIIFKYTVNTQYCRKKGKKEQMHDNSSSVMQCKKAEIANFKWLNDL